MTRVISTAAFKILRKSCSMSVALFGYGSIESVSLECIGTTCRVSVSCPFLVRSFGSASSQISSSLSLNSIDTSVNKPSVLAVVQVRSHRQLREYRSSVSSSLSLLCHVHAIVDPRQARSTNFLCVCECWGGVGLVVGRGSSTHSLSINNQRVQARKQRRNRAKQKQHMIHTISSPYCKPEKQRSSSTQRSSLSHWGRRLKPHIPPMWSRCLPVCEIESSKGFFYLSDVSLLAMKTIAFGIGPATKAVRAMQLDLVLESQLAWPRPPRS